MVENNAPMTAQSHQTLGKRPMQVGRLTILVVDDDVDVRTTLADMLTAAGYRVQQAENGVAALAQMRDRPAELVITDIMMPEKEGLETIRDLQEEFPDTRIVAISGGGAASNLNYLDMAQRMGADNVLPKPIRRDDLTAVVDQLFLQAPQTNSGPRVTREPEKTQNQ